MAICLAGPAIAGGLSPPMDGPQASQCGAVGKGCVRIRGYIAAGPEFSSETVVARPSSFASPAPAFLTGLGAAGQAAADAIGHGLFFLRTGGAR